MTLSLIAAIVAAVLFGVAGYLATDRATKFVAIGLALLALAWVFVRVP
jgi:hypothetical protein